MGWAGVGLESGGADGSVWNDILNWIRRFRGTTASHI